MDNSFINQVNRIKEYNKEMPKEIWQIKVEKTPADYSPKGKEITPSKVHDRKIIDEEGNFIASITTAEIGEAIANFIVNSKSDVSILLETVEYLNNKLNENPKKVAEESAIKEIEGLRKGVTRLSEDKKEWQGKYSILKKKEEVFNEAPKNIALLDNEIKKLKREKDLLINTLMIITRLCEIIESEQTDETVLEYINTIKKVKKEDIFIIKRVLNTFKAHYNKIRSNNEIKGNIKRELKYELMSKGLI